MLACELVIAIQAEHGELAEVLIRRCSALHGFGAGEGEARHARGGRRLILLPDGMLLEEIQEISRGGCRAIGGPFPKNKPWRRACHLIKPEGVIEKMLGYGAAVSGFEVVGGPQD